MTQTEPIKSNAILEEIWQIKDELAREANVDLHQLCGNRAPVVMEAFRPDGTHKILREKKPPGESGIPPANAPT